jgi:tRNA A-37 threonylcarbamoyl transferase component Bud32
MRLNKYNEFINILEDFYDKNKDISKLKERIFKKYTKNNIVYSIRRQFRERMERELKYLLKDKFNK